MPLRNIASDTSEPTTRTNPGNDGPRRISMGRRKDIDGVETQDKRDKKPNGRIAIHSEFLRCLVDGQDFGRQVRT